MQHVHRKCIVRLVLYQLRLSFRLVVGDDTGEDTGLLRIGACLLHPAVELIHFQMIQRAAVVFVQAGQHIVHRQEVIVGDVEDTVSHRCAGQQHHGAGRLVDGRELHPAHQHRVRDGTQHPERLHAAH